MIGGRQINWKRLGRWVFILALLPPLGLMVLAYGLHRYGRTQSVTPSPTARYEAIIVFGARVRRDGEASTLLRERTRHAFELWQQGVAPKIVCTGGVGHYPPAEALVQARLLQEWGVPPEAILLDETSTTTRENAENAARLLGHSGVIKVVAVSEPFHLWRCRRDCARFGLDATPSAELPGWQQLSVRAKILYCLREALAVSRDVAQDLFT